jgi:hypothetical protein
VPSRAPLNIALDRASHSGYLMIILAIALAALSALFRHVMVRRFWIATVLGTITAVLLELVIAGSHLRMDGRDVL